MKRIDNKVNTNVDIMNKGKILKIYLAIVLILSILIIELVAYFSVKEGLLLAGLLLQIVAALMFFYIYSIKYSYTLNGSNLEFTNIFGRKKNIDLAGYQDWLWFTVKPSKLVKINTAMIVRLKRYGTFKFTTSNSKASLNEIKSEDKTKGRFYIKRLENGACVFVLTTALFTGFYLGIVTISAARADIDLVVKVERCKDKYFLSRRTSGGTILVGGSTSVDAIDIRGIRFNFITTKIINCDNAQPGTTLNIKVKKNYANSKLPVVASDINSDQGYIILKSSSLNYAYLSLAVWFIVCVITSKPYMVSLFKFGIKRRMS